MKFIICGSRNIIPYPRDRRTQANGIELIQPGLMFQWIDATISQVFTTPITEVISGAARGGDEFGELWAKERNIPLKRFPVRPEEWRLLGKSAGMIRNRTMADYAALNGPENAGVLAIWDGKSRGTLGMLEYARKLGIQSVALQPNGAWRTMG